MRPGRQIKRLLALTTVVLGFSVAAAAPAFAADMRVEQGDDFATMVRFDPFDEVEVCDREADGHGVYVKVLLNDGYDEFGDGNGSASPCAYRDYGSLVENIMVCETVTGPDWCSDWAK